MIQINQVYIMCLFVDHLLYYEFYIYNSYLDFPSDSFVENAGDPGSLGQEDPLGKEMAAHSSFLA